MSRNGCDSRIVADSQQLAAIKRELDIARQIQSSILLFYDFLELGTHRSAFLSLIDGVTESPPRKSASMVKMALALAAQRPQGSDVLGCTQVHTGHHR